LNRAFNLWLICFSSYINSFPCFIASNNLASIIIYLIRSYIAWMVTIIINFNRTYYVRYYLAQMNN